jgi:hypothetical protein
LLSRSRIDHEITIILRREDCPLIAAGARIPNALSACVVNRKVAVFLHRQFGTGSLPDNVAVCVIPKLEIPAGCKP